MCRSAQHLKCVAALSIATLALGSVTAFAGTKSVEGSEVRDWQAVDLNSDDAISPEEMDKFLRDTWAKNASK